VPVSSICHGITPTRSRETSDQINKERGSVLYQKNRTPAKEKTLAQTLRPGEEVPASGIYVNVQTGDRVTVNEGDPLPPTPGPGQTYKPVILTDPSRKPGR
jgi:hypothetical protein